MEKVAMQAPAEQVQQPMEVSADATCMRRSRALVKAKALKRNIVKLLKIGRTCLSRLTVMGWTRRVAMRPAAASEAVAFETSSPNCQSQVLNASMEVLFGTQASARWSGSTISANLPKARLQGQCLQQLWQSHSCVSAGVVHVPSSTLEQKRFSSTGNLLKTARATDTLLASLNAVPVPAPALDGAEQISHITALGAIDLLFLLGPQPSSATAVVPSEALITCQETTGDPYLVFYESPPEDLSLSLHVVDPFPASVHPTSINSFMYDLPGVAIALSIAPVVEASCLDPGACNLKPDWSANVDPWELTPVTAAEAASMITGTCGGPDAVPPLHHTLPPVVFPVPANSLCNAGGGVSPIDMGVIDVFPNPHVGVAYGRKSSGLYGDPWNMHQEHCWLGPPGHQPHGPAKVSTFRGGAAVHVGCGWPAAPGDNCHGSTCAPACPASNGLWACGSGSLLTILVVDDRATMSQ